MSIYFRRSVGSRFWRERLRVTFDDGSRVIVQNDAGNVMLDCSRAVFDACWKRGWFTDA